MKTGSAETKYNSIRFSFGSSCEKNKTKRGRKKYQENKTILKYIVDEQRATTTNSLFTRKPNYD